MPCRVLMVRRVQRGMVPVLFVGGLATLMIVRPLMYGVTPPEAARFWAFVLAYLLAPGLLAYRMFASENDDWLFWLGMGWTLGHALEILVYVGLKALGASSLFTLYPLMFLPLAVWMVRRPRRANPSESPSMGSALPVAALLVIIAVVVEMQPLFSPHVGAEPIPLDFLLQLGYGGELLRHWPLENSRVAGLPLNYHIFAYALPAGASQVTGIPATTSILCLVPVTVTLLSLQIYNVGRMIFRDHLAGLLAAAVFMFHTDPGAALAPLIGHFNSYLSLGIYASVTTVNGFIFLVGLTAALSAWLADTGRPSWPQAALLALLAAVLSGTKGSVMPVVLLGLAGVLAWQLGIRRRLSRRLLAALTILVLASGPMTAKLAFGPQSDRVVLGWAPGSIVYASPFYNQLVHVTRGSAWLTLDVTLMWLVGYLGLAGIGGCLYLLRRGDRLSDLEAWMVTLLVSGLATAYLLGASGALAQLFFLYNGQLMLALLSGSALARLVRSPRDYGPAWIALVLLFAVPMTLQTAREVRANLWRDAQAPHRSTDGLVRAYAEGIAWLRDRSPVDAVVLADHDAPVVSAYAERRAFYETGIYTPQSDRLRWISAAEPFPERVAARAQFFLGPTPELVRALVRQHGTVYALVDNLRIQGHTVVTLSVGAVRDTTLALPEGFASLEYSNDAMRIYRLRVPPDP